VKFLEGGVKIIMEISLPYGNESIKVNIPGNRLNELMSSKTHDYEADESEKELVKNALRNPVSTPSLDEMAKGKDEIVIISSDHTRPVPSKVTMPVILEEIRRYNPEAYITILVATGCHRSPTEDELKDKYGSEIFEEENIVIHDSDDQSNLVNIGILPSGGELVINKIALEADLLIAEGFIEPHFFAGFSGGRKSVLPGIASRTTVLANHCSEFIAHEWARTGILEGNPIHRDMLFAAKKAGLYFIINVVIDSNKNVINVFAGDVKKAHIEGCNFVSKLAGIKSKPADIVITTNGGYPLDQNIYQSVKSMTAAEATCCEGGVIIVISECSDGHGGINFYNTFKNADNIQEVMDDILNRARYETVPDQWQSQILARILLKYTVILVTDAPRTMVENMHMKYARNVEEAINMAIKLTGNDADISVIVNGVSVIVN